MSFVFIFFLLVYACGVNTSRVYNDEDKKVLKRYCYSCHAPSSELHAQPLVYMYSKYGEEKLMEVLESEFRSAETDSLYHKGIKLSRKELESIILALKDGFPSLKGSISK